MWRRILACLAALLLTIAVAPSGTRAQKLENRWRPSQQQPTDEEKERGPPALQYTVAAIATIVVMVILCMPSRKKAIS
jgi:hypothetical protein